MRGPFYARAFFSMTGRKRKEKRKKKKRKKKKGEGGRILSIFPSPRQPVRSKKGGDRENTFLHRAVDQRGERGKRERKMARVSS